MLGFLKALWAIKEVKGAILATGGALVSAVMTNVVPYFENSSPATALIIAAVASTILNVIQRQVAK